MARRSTLGELVDRDGDRLRHRARRAASATASRSSRSTDFDDGRIDSATLRRFDASTASSGLASARLRAGDVSSSRSATSGEVGCVVPARLRSLHRSNISACFVPTAQRSTRDSSTASCAADRAADSQLMRRRRTVSDMPQLARRSHDFELAVPPLAEQRAIAHILGTLDDKIELNRRMNETLEAMARALFKSWFVDFDPVRAKAEGRDPGLPSPSPTSSPTASSTPNSARFRRGGRCGRLGEHLRAWSDGKTPSDDVPGTYWQRWRHPADRSVTVARRVSRWSWTPRSIDHSAEGLTDSSGCMAMFRARSVIAITTALASVGRVCAIVSQTSVNQSRIGASIA